MLVQESFHEVPTTVDGQGSMGTYNPSLLGCHELHASTITYLHHIFAKQLHLGIYVFHPTVPGYPKARFPGVVVFSEIYQGRRP